MTENIEEQTTKNREFLHSKYGVLMTTEHVAEVLHRTRQGLENNVNKANPPKWAEKIRAAKRKVGRYIYYSSDIIAEVLTDIMAGKYDDEFITTTHAA